MFVKRMITVLLALGLFFAFVVAVTGGEEKAEKKKEAQTVPEKITVNLPEGAKKDAVTFPHKKHLAPKDKDGLGYACTKCHHNYKEGEKIKKCDECHKLSPADDDETPKFKDAFHKTCLECHKKGEGKETEAPKKCKECHKKAE